MSIDQIYSILGIITNISFLPILVLMLTSGLFRRHPWFTAYIALYALWGYGDYLMGQTEDYLPIWRQFNFCAILLPWSFWSFTADFTKKKSRILSGIILSLTGFFLILNYTNNLLLPDVIVEKTGWDLVRAIPLYDFFALFSCLVVFRCTLQIIRYYQKNTVIYRWMVLGYILTLMGEVYSYGSVYFESWYDFPYIAYFVNFLPYFLTYLILRHRLFDARSYLLALIQWTIIIIIAGIVGWGMFELLSSAGFHPHIDIPLVMIIGMTALVITLLARSKRIRQWFQLSDITVLEQGITEFLSASAVYRSHDEVRSSILSALKNGLGIDTIGLISRTDIANYPELQEIFTRQNPPLSLELTIRPEDAQDTNGQDIIRHLPSLQLLGKLFLPIRIQGHISSLIVLPEKKSQAPFSITEKKLLETLLPKIALSLQILEYNQILRDEVERQTLQIEEQRQALEASYKKLEILDIEKDRFMNMAAHELRTPITIIRGYTDIMLSNGIESDPEKRKVIDNIAKNSELLLSLVNDLLNIARIDAGKMELKYEPCDLSQLAQTLYENFSPLMQKKDIHFSMSHNPGVEDTFSTDASKVTFILNNLLSNAYKFTRENGTVEWHIGQEKRGDISSCVITVSDTGVGIPEEEIPHVFDRFAKISTHDILPTTIESTGLGLSIVKKIVDGMGGTIAVESTVGEGTKFTVAIPNHGEIVTKSKKTK